MILGTPFLKMVPNKSLPVFTSFLPWLSFPLTENTGLLFFITDQLGSRILFFVP